MGTTSTKSSKVPPVIQSGENLIMQLRSRSIIIHYAYKMSLHIGDVGIFPHGLSSLKLW